MSSKVSYGFFVIVFLVVPSMVLGATPGIENIRCPAPGIENIRCSDDNCKGTIGNTIWYDYNRDGIQQDSEPGIENIRVKAEWAGEDGKYNNSDDEEYRTNTNHNGHYLFENMPKGEYRIVVKEEDVAHLIQTYDPTGSSMNNETSLTLDCNDDYTKADFGFTNTEQTLAVTGIHPLAFLKALFIR